MPLPTTHKCARCKLIVSELGEYVKTRSGRTHLTCYLEPIVCQARLDGLRELREAQAEEIRRRETAASYAAAQEKREADARAEALRIVNAENARRVEATKRETDKLRESQRGAETPRFAQVAEEMELAATALTPILIPIPMPAAVNLRPIEMD